MKSDNRPVTAAIMAFPDCTASVVHGLYDLFMSAGRDWGLIVDGRPGPQRMQARIVSAHAGPFPVANGLVLQPEGGLDTARVPDIVCVPELFIAPGEPLDGFAKEIAWLRHCHASGAIVSATCSGAMLLAEAGLLDGHPATTHWAYCDILAQRYPRVQVQRQRTLVTAGEGQRLIMTGGGSSWLDLALYLIARTTDVETAMQVARINLIDWHVIGQQPFARLARSRQVEDAVIARCQTWIADHYHEPAPVAAMVRLSGLAERSFKRRFQQATGMPPLEYVHTLRLEEAKHMLESGTMPVEAVANAVGYEDAGFFSRMFRLRVSLTPGQYRKRFGSVRKALQTGEWGAASP